MAWFDPSPAEMSLIEQIETAYYDDYLQRERRRRLLHRLWIQLEKMHGDRVIHLVSPEGDVIRSPLVRD